MPLPTCLERLGCLRAHICPYIYGQICVLHTIPRIRDIESAHERDRLETYTHTHTAHTEASSGDTRTGGAWDGRTTQDCWAGGTARHTCSCAASSWHVTPQPATETKRALPQVPEPVPLPCVKLLTMHEVSVSLGGGRGGICGVTMSQILNSTTPYTTDLNQN